MSAPWDFFSCDWGTSSFRLRRVRGADLSVVAEVKEALGVRIIFEKGGDRAKVYEEFLFSKLEELGGKKEMPLVISGMASSSIGWRELAYAKTPFGLDGLGLRAERLEWAGPAWLGKTFLVSGVATEKDVMRGEETQIVGVMAGSEMAAFREKSILVLPGTHSKHVKIDGGMVRDFTTYMTGEIYEVMGRQSILRATVSIGENGDVQSFKEGVLTGAHRGLAGSLFLARTRGVLGGKTPGQNSVFLSGLVIGDELRNLAASEDPIVIAGEGGLPEKYQLAMEIIGKKPATLISNLGQATVAAHSLILRNFG